MKKIVRTSLSDVVLECNPLSQDSEGLLRGGFVGMQGSSVGAALNTECTNNSCNNSSCSNEKCINNGDCSNSGNNNKCVNGTTATPTETTETTLPNVPVLSFF
ncbi:MAG: hypothetical protein PUD79_08055 [Prevotellaceae bacterium]|nr:hypothetical protein [Prevotellaceae bacterium]